MKKFYITDEERSLITLTPQNECWICDLFSNNVNKDKRGFFIPKKIFQDIGLIEHLQQIVNRSIMQ
ncbi:MAG TPA: hypothetical protein VI757_05510 [Bacteroidia bacterium]|nr:hypothetical protein [Bacteroidia bacterium]